MNELYRSYTAPTETAALQWALKQSGYWLTNCHALTTGDYVVFVKRIAQRSTVARCHVASVASN